MVACAFCGQVKEKVFKSKVSDAGICRECLPVVAEAMAKPAFKQTIVVLERTK